MRSSPISRTEGSPSTTTRFSFGPAHRFVHSPATVPSPCWWRKPCAVRAVRLLSGAGVPPTFFDIRWPARCSGKELRCRRSQACFDTASIATTEIYAKVDVVALGEIAQPWPEGDLMLTQAVESYLGVRRAMGFALHSEGSLLQSFANYPDAAGKTSHICNETAIQWAGVARLATTRARRLGHVIRFARYLRAEDQRHEIPPTIFSGCEKGPRLRALHLLC